MADLQAQKANVLALLGLARRAGAVQMGSGAVMRCLDRGQQGIVFLATDAGGDIGRRIQRAASGQRIEADLLSGEDLAGALGRAKLSVVSVHEPGFVSGLAGHLNDRGE